MISLVQKLSQLGASPEAPTDMSQIKVPQQPMDLAGTIPAANDQISYAGAQKAVDNQVDWKGAGMGLLAGAVGSMGGKPQQQQFWQAHQFQGGREPELVNAEKISSMNQAGQQKWAQVPGLMSKG